MKHCGSLTNVPGRQTGRRQCSAEALLCTAWWRESADHVEIVDHSINITGELVALHCWGAVHSREQGCAHWPLLGGPYNVYIEDSRQQEDQGRAVLQ